MICCLLFLDYEVVIRYGILLFIFLRLGDGYKKNKYYKNIFDFYWFF